MPVTHRLKKRRHNQAHALCCDSRRNGKGSSLGRFTNCGLRVADACQYSGHQEQHVRLERRAEPSAQQFNREERMLLGLHGRGFVLHHSLSEQGSQEQRRGCNWTALAHQQRRNDGPLVQHASAARRYGGTQSVGDTSAFIQLCSARSRDCQRPSTRSKRCIGERTRSSSADTISRRCASLTAAAAMTLGSAAPSACCTTSLGADSQAMRRDSSA